MPEILTKDELRNKIIDILVKDDRTLGHLAKVSDAVSILEHPEALTGSNWEIAQSAASEGLPKHVRAALVDAEAAARALYRLALKPLGITG